MKLFVAVALCMGTSQAVWSAPLQLDGRFTVREKIELNEAVLGGMYTQKASYSQGIYKATVYPSSDKLQLLLGEGFGAKLFILKTFEPIRWVEGSKQYLITAQENSQPYDLLIQNDMATIASDSRVGQEECVYETREVYRCRDYCDGHGRNRRCERRCGWERENVYGIRDYTYRYETTEYQSGLSFLLPSSDHALNDSQLFHTERREVRESTGECRLR